MSRYYEMNIWVNGVKEDQVENVLRVLKSIFWREGASEALEAWKGVERELLTETEQGGFRFWMVEEGHLYGGEFEDEFAVRVYESLRAVCPEVGMCLEAQRLDELPPHNTYRFGPGSEEENEED